MVEMSRKPDDTSGRLRNLYRTRCYSTLTGSARTENGSSGPKEKRRKEPPVDELPPSVFDGASDL